MRSVLRRSPTSPRGYVACSEARALILGRQFKDALAAHPSSRPPCALCRCQGVQALSWLPRSSRRPSQPLAPWPSQPLAPWPSQPWRPVSSPSVSRRPRPSRARSAPTVREETRALRGVPCARSAHCRRNRRALAAARAQRPAAGVRRPLPRGAGTAAPPDAHARTRTALPLAWIRVVAPVPAPGPVAPPPDAARREPRS